MGHRFSEYARRRAARHNPYGSEDADNMVGYISLAVILWIVVTGVLERIVQ